MDTCRRGGIRRWSGYALLPVVFTLAAVGGVALYLTFEGGMTSGTTRNQLEGEALRMLSEAGFSQTVWKSRTLDCAAYSGEPLTGFNSHQFQSSVSPDTGSPMGVTVTATLDSGLTRTDSRSLTRFSLSRQKVDQPGPIIATDTALELNKPNGNFGEAKEFALGSDARALIYFDLSSLPAASTVYSATLTLSTPGDPYGPITVDLHRVTADWNEGTDLNGTTTPADGATWNERKPGIAWTTPGGDYDPTVISSFNFTTPGESPTYDVTGLVRDWVNQAQPNYGLILIGRLPEAGLSIIASDKPSVNARPKLTIDYSCPCGAGCDVTQYCDANYSANRVVSSFNTSQPNNLGGYDITSIEFLEAGITFNGVTVTGDGGLLVLDALTGMLHLTDLTGVLLTSLKLPNPKPVAIAYARSGPWTGSLAVANEYDTAAGFETRFIYRVSMDGTLEDQVYYGFETLTVLDLVIPETTTAGSLDGSLVVSTNTNWKGQSGNRHARIIAYDYAGNMIGEMSLQNISPHANGIAHINGTDRFLLADKAGAVNIVDIPTEGVLQTYDSIALGLVKPTGATIDRNNCTHVIVEQGEREIPSTHKLNFLDVEDDIIILPPPPDPVPL